MRRRIRGTTTVEFAIIGALLITLMLAVIEFGRLLFTMAVTKEATRRGARLAAVCPINDAAVVNAVTFVSLPGLSAVNVAVEYLDAGSNVIAGPAGNVAQIRYVRVRLVDYQFPLWIPFLNVDFSSPEFEATIPRESLGGAPPVAC